MRLITVPYHLGRAGVGMGAGPDALLAADLATQLAVTVHDVPTLERVAYSEPFHNEIGTHFAIQQQVAGAVSRAVQAAEFPFVLGGCCTCVLGAVAGLEPGTGVVWFDAHGDFNTPQTSRSGFLDGMAIAILTGRAWQAMAQSIPGFAPLDDAEVLLAGVRDLDDDERDHLGSSGIAVTGPAELGSASWHAALDRLSTKVERIHVHVDLDVIDLDDGRANEYAVPGGPSLDQLTEAITAIAEHCPVAGVSLTSYNPAVDSDGRGRAAGLRIGAELARLATR
jgi:arginase